MKMKKTILSAVIASFAAIAATAQTGTAAEPVAYVGGEICNPRLHEGGLRYAIGTENIQVMRANRTHPEDADDYGWTYNHAANITYWNGRFYLQYLSNPADEQQPPGHTLIVSSQDGRSWGKPQVAFPAYTPPEGITPQKPYYGYIMHQRMGFYTAPNGRLLTLAFYGHSYDPFRQGGIGRVVREVYRDGTMGPIYFIRYTSHADWNESNTSYPFYTRSKDKGFREACQALLADPLKTLQWIDEDRGLDGFYHLKDSINRVQATSYFHRNDGHVVALWKWSYAALSADEGLSWSTPVRIPSLIMAGGKNWGQRTRDGRYAMVYNPIETQPYRYPLVAVTSDDGIRFDSMAVVHGEVPPRRFFGENKDFGPCYVRGITEGEQQPDDQNMWLAYTVNKEDVWVSRVPLPVRTTWEGPVDDDFSTTSPGAPIANWNIYRPRWCDVFVDNDHRLCLTDSDTYDYARAIRVFQQAEHARITFGINIVSEGDEPFEVDVTDRHGERALSLSFHQGIVSTAGRVVGHYQLGSEQTITIDVDTRGSGTTRCAGNVVPNLHAVSQVERISFRTGPYRCLPDRHTPNQDKHEPLPACDVRAAATTKVCIS
ncbi:MAG: exo-alpha-sialidase, partial [Prevotella sp.]|nr:exo-alpha-sialidase [Prevotella sp.]